MRLNPFRKKPALSDAQQKEHRAILQLTKDPQLKPEGRAAMQKYADLYATGKYGTGSSLFTHRTGKEAVIARAAAEKDTQQLPQAGIWGIVAYALGKYGLGSFMARRKRKEVLQGIKAYTDAKPGDFRRLVFATARYIYSNHVLKGTIIHDKKSEAAIYELFGELAQKSTDYSSKNPRRENQSITEYGKEYFRSLVRENLLSDFKFIQRHFADPERREALKYCLIGEIVDPLTEEADIKRLTFITDIFRKDVPELNRFHDARTGTRDRALQALLRLRFKANNFLGTKEAVNFYYQVCEYYRIQAREVDIYAMEIYWGARKLSRPGKPKGKPDARQRAEYERELRTASAREKEIKERIEAIYGRETLEKFRPKPARQGREGSRIVLTPAASFRLAKERMDWKETQKTTPGAIAKRESREKTYFQQ